MKIKFLLFFLILNYSLSAGDFRGGDIHIEQHTALSVQVNINVNLIIHSEIDQITICWGDGSCEILGNPQILENPSIDSKTLLFYWIHNYNQFGFYEITVEECCWADDIVNMNLVNEQDFVLQASFKLLDPLVEPFNVMPVSLSLPVSVGDFNELLIYDSFVNIPQSDESTFEICEVDVDNYFLLEEIFMDPDNFIFDPATGGFIWFNPPSPGFFIVKVCITTTRGGQLISETSRDILIAIKNIVDIEILGNSNDFGLKCYPNPAQDFIRFEYNLKEKSNVEIELFNALGKKIKTLLSETKSNGNHEETIELHNLPQGFYFCKIKIEDTIHSIPFIKR